MKQPKKLRLIHKIMIAKDGHNPDDYMFHRETETSWVFIKKKTGLFLEIEK